MTLLERLVALGVGALLVLGLGGLLVLDIALDIFGAKG